MELIHNSVDFGFGTIENALGVIGYIPWVALDLITGIQEVVDQLIIPVSICHISI